MTKSKHFQELLAKYGAERLANWLYELAQKMDRSQDYTREENESQLDSWLEQDGEMRCA